MFILLEEPVLLYNNLKPSTKDIDLIVNSKKEFKLLTSTLEKLDFKLEKPTKEYSNFNLENIIIKENYRFDIFNKIVCNNLFLSKNMIKRAKIIKKFKNINLFVCSLEDILVFKSITTREGDVDDCKSISRLKLDWKIILKEIEYQIKISGNNIWITWFEERLNLLEDKGINVLIIKEIRKLSFNYYKNLEKKLK